jgi:hypothetical protein
MDELLGMATDFIKDKVLHMKKPEADLTDVQVKQFDRNGLELESNVSIHNPYSHDLPIFELTYQIKSGGRYTYIHTHIKFHTHTDRYAYIYILIGILGITMMLYFVPWELLTWLSLLYGPAQFFSEVCGCL